MAKRFIDTGLFDDEWFAELNPECKIFWVYYLTKCDHAGILKYNKRLIEFQTGVKNLDKVLQLFENRLTRVKDSLFCPKFIHFQYPNFPNSGVRQQDSALKILVANGIWDEQNKQFTNSYLTLSKDLPKSYGHGNGNGNDSGNGSEHEHERKNLIFPFDSPGFVNLWNILTKQPKWKKKSQDALQASLKKLSEYPEEVAMKMIEESIANGWQGLFELKNKQHGSSANKQGATKDGLIAKLDERFAKQRQSGSDGYHEAV